MLLYNLAIPAERQHFNDNNQSEVFEKTEFFDIYVNLGLDLDKFSPSPLIYKNLKVSETE